MDKQRCIVLQRANFGTTNPLYLAWICEWDGNAWESIAKVHPYPNLSVKWEWRDKKDGPSRSPRNEADLVELRAAIERDGYGDVELVYLQTDHGLKRISSVHPDEPAEQPQGANDYT